MDELRFISTSGLAHGRGIDGDELDVALELEPHFVGIDTGSTDAGPYWLGSGENQYPSRGVMKEILRTLLTRTVPAEVPLIIGSAGTAGSRVHVDWFRDVVREVSVEEGLTYTLATGYSDIDQAYLHDKFASGKTTPLDGAESLTEELIADLERVVAAMGPEPYIEALNDDADVLVMGRSSDVSIFSALPLDQGFPPGLTHHLAKTVECGGQILKPDGSGMVYAELTKDWFRVRPVSDDRYTTPLAIASHLLYEQANPYEFVEPRGTFSTRACTYRAVDDWTVEVRGTEFQPADQYTMKLEGVRRVGYRCMSMNGVRDPLLIDQIDSFLDDIRSWLATKASEMGLSEPEFGVTFHLYGKNGVMGDWEPIDSVPHEIGVFSEVIAPTADDAHALSHLVSGQLLHSSFPGRKCTAGNTATPLSPGDINVGEAFEFCVWHTIDIDDPLEPVSIEIEQVGEGSG